jgi:cell division protein FtsI/penicillin-binding protein 2
MNIGASIRKLSYIFILSFIALSGGLVYWQVVKADNVTATLHNPRNCLTSNTPLRGRIFDRNGVLLAESLPDPNVCGGYIRHYTEPSLANLIGYYVPGDFMPDGIEKQYNAILNGTATTTPLDQETNKLLHTAPVGDDIYLTIDVRIQRLAVQEFNDYHPLTDPLYFQTYSKGLNAPSDRGSVVISDPHTGEILALVSSPGYDPNKMVQTLSAGDDSYYNSVIKNPEQPMLDRPLVARYSPGSTFKTVTLMAALDSGATTLNTNWNQKQAMGPLYYDGSQIKGDNLGYGEFVFHFPINTEFAYANSDNIVFAQIGVKTGAQTWLNYTKKLYIDQPLPFDLPTATSSVLNSNGTPLSTLQLAANSYGQGIDNITPLEMSLIDNTVANNGILMRPALISRIIDPNQNPLQTFSPQQLDTVISPDTAFKMRVAMSAVTTCGSGWHLSQNLGYQDSIAGKTGTAEIGNNKIAHGWMITQAPFTLNTTDPEQMPALTIVAMRENGGEGAYAVGPAIWKMYNDIFSKDYVQAQLPAQLTSDPYCLNNNLWQTR